MISLEIAKKARFEQRALFLEEQEAHNVTKAKLEDVEAQNKAYERVVLSHALEKDKLLVDKEVLQSKLASSCSSAPTEPPAPPVIEETFVSDIRECNALLAIALFV